MLLDCASSSFFVRLLKYVFHYFCTRLLGKLISFYALIRMSTSSLPSIPTSPLQSVLNFRDVGKIVNLLLCGSLPSLKPDLFYRSARPDEASSVDRHALTDIYRVRTVIDLRSTTEHIEQASKRNENAQGAGLVATNDDEAAATVRIPGLKYIDINLNGGGFVRALLWKLSWGSLVRVLALITTGYRTQVIRILTTEVMNPRGLVGLGKDSLDYSKYEIRQVFEILADDKNYPILAHCTQGKDVSNFRSLS